MNADLTAFTAFIILISIFLIIKRKKLAVHKFLHIFYFCMYRTRIGLKFMDYIAVKFSKFLMKSSVCIITVCFAGMIFVSFELVRGMYGLLAHEQSPAVSLVLPFEVKGAFYVPFIYWIACIFIVAFVHEFSHGIFARRCKVKVISSGFAFLGIILPLIPAAFVEPDEKQLQKKKKKEQLAVFSAGPFANIFLGLITLAVFYFALTPITDNYYTHYGVEIVEVVEGSPADGALLVGQVINEINAKKIETVDDFKEAFGNKKPADEIKISAGEKETSIILSENPSNADDAYLGVFVKQTSELKDISVFQRMLIYIKDFFYWLFILNLGVGAFNLVPIGPLDGGRMFRTAALGFLKKRSADSVLKSVSFIFLFIIIGSVVFGAFW